jgi:hypothetical protein
MKPLLVCFGENNAILNYFGNNDKKDEPENA